MEWSAPSRNGSHPYREGAESDHVVSRADHERLTNYLVYPRCLFGQCAIRFEHQRNGVLQIGASFFQGRSLSVGAWKLLNEADVAFRHTTKNDGELDCHVFIIPRCR
jgi:hypothetical protein